ncbi:unnamed protein product [Cyclocybe aegerita]|uniref:Uncharacterized protein n=1 Tax=Cyclocybe aegerita TaxID=1973307 RepID=A0A8S0W286_CYCAE|nr:unnamed protein product [Cyclocybe aegerita]
MDCPREPAALPAAEPCPSDLLPLLTSPHLASSLLLLATHAPPSIPALPPNALGPAVRVLRLPAPLAVHDSGALRLVSLFERAARVARLWRYSSQSTSTAHYPRIIQLAEEVPGGQFTLVEPFVYASPAPQNDMHVPPTTTQASAQAPPHPTPTPHTSNQHTHNLNLTANPKYPSPAPSIVSYASYASTSTSPSTSRPPSLSTYAPSSTSTTSLPSATQRKRQHRTQSALRKLMNVDSSPNSHAVNNNNMRTFDALINFLPANLPDKALLKHAVLVSTLSSQYLAVPPSTPSALHASSYTTHSGAGESIPRPLSKRFSAFSFASFTISPSSTPSSSLSSTPLGSTPETSPCPSPPPPLAPAHPFPHEKLTDRFTSSGSGVHKVKSKRSSSRMSVLSLSGILRVSTPVSAVPAVPPSASASSSSPSLSSDSPSRRPSTIHSNSSACTTGGRGAGAGTNTNTHPLAYPHGDKPKNAHLVHVLPVGWVAEEVRAEAEALRLQERERRRRQMHAYAPVLSSGLRPLPVEEPVGDEDGPVEDEDEDGRRASTRPTLATRQLQGHSSSYEHVGGVGGGMSGKRSSSVPLLSNAGVQVQVQGQQRRRGEKPKLVQSVEQFLLAFAYPLGSVAAPSPVHCLRRPPSSSQHPSSHLELRGQGKERARPTSAYLASGSGSGSEEAAEGGAGRRASYLGSSGSTTSMGALADVQADASASAQSKPIPYLVAPGVWGAEVRGTRRSRNPHHLSDESTEREMTIGEIVLLGALDSDHELAGGLGGGVGRTGGGMGGGIGNGGNGGGRAWVGCVEDVQVVVLEDSRDHEEAPEREERRANWKNGLETGAGLTAKEGKEEGKEEEEDQRRKDSERKRRTSHHHQHHHHHYGHGLPTPPETSSSEEGDEVDDGECEEEFHTPVQSPASIRSPVRERLESQVQARPAPRLQTNGSTQIQGQGQGQVSAQASPTRSPTKSHTAVAHPIPRPPPLVAGSASSRTGRRVSGSVDGYEGELEEYAGPGSARSQRSTSLSSAGSTVQRQGQEGQGKHETPTPTIMLSAPSPALSGSFARSQGRGHGHVHVQGQRPNGSGSGSLPSAARSAVEVRLGSRHYDTDHEKARKEAKRRSVVSLVIPGTRSARESGRGRKRGDGHGGSGHGQVGGSGFGAVLRRLGIRWG